MVFSILVIVAVLGVAYLQFLQGAFTAAISFACAVVATLVAFGYYENLVNQTQQNGFADYAAGMVLIVLFSVTYIVLRVVVDSAVPGNLALPLYVDKLGAGVFGLGAGLLAGGVFATGLQIMPFGPSVAGFAPYDLQDRSPLVVPAAIAGLTRGRDSGVQDELVPEKFQNRGGLLLPADAFATGLVKMASAGAFAGTQSFAVVHPDLQAEGFYARLGGDKSFKRVALNSAKKQNVTVGGVFTLGPVVGLDAEAADLRPNKQSLTYKPEQGRTLVVVRVGFSDAAADKDGIARLTPAGARLVVGEPPDNEFFPIGSMEGTATVGLNRLDDLIPMGFKDGARSVDLVYALPKALAAALTKPPFDPATPAFVEAKLFGRVDLHDVKVEPYASAPKSGGPVRKPSSPLMSKAAATPVG